jgi:tetratricopeptide (TPR) repeat protein
VELTAAAALVGAWNIHTYFGPAIAAVHWNRYLRASVADTELATKSLEHFVAGGEVPMQDRRLRLSQAMLRHLEAAAYWDPSSARIHERLADRYVTAFELRMSEAENSMDVSQIRATATDSAFTSPEQLHAWLKRAFGPESDYLRKAFTHARCALTLSPLQADAYLRMADLLFLELAPARAEDAYVEQVMRIRPFDRNVLATAGRQSMQKAQFDAALEHWKKCFHTPGRHQLEIVYLLVANGMPASEFVVHFRPDWRTLPLVWSQYKKVGDPSQLDALLSYAARLAEQHGTRADSMPAVYVWSCLSSFYDDVGRTDAALVTMQRAYRCDPRQYFVRRALAKKLQAADRLAEAEPHIRWCLARRPADKALSDALLENSRARFAQRGSAP